MVPPQEDKKMEARYRARKENGFVIRDMVVEYIVLLSAYRVSKPASVIKC